MNPFDNKKLEMNSEWHNIINGSAVAITIRKSCNKDVVLAAVKRDPTTFKYVSQEFQNDPDVVLAAIELGAPSFMGKIDNEDCLSRSLEAISKHSHLLDSIDLNFLCVCKINFRSMERDIESMGWYKKKFSDKAKHLKRMRDLYQKKVNLFMKRIREYDNCHKKQVEDEQEKNLKKEESQRYFEFREKLKEMPLYETWKKDVIKKCGNKCQIDKSHASRKVEVHHIDSLFLIYKLNDLTSNEKIIKCKQLWDINNGIILCKECHDQMESSKNRQSFMTEK